MTVEYAFLSNALAKFFWHKYKQQGSKFSLKKQATSKQQSLQFWMLQGCKKMHLWL